MLANIIRNSKKSVGGGGIVIDGGDPYYSAVSLMLSMDGTNGSTTFTDSSLNALTVTRTGTPAISTAQSKYGGSSVAFSGSTDRLGVASNALFAFGTGDFTVEFWVYFNSISTSFVQLYDTYVTGGFSFYWSGSASTLIISNRSTNQIVQAWSPSANTWYHLAVSRSGTSLRLFINGTVLGSTTASTSYVQGALQIGGTADNTSYSLNGYIDDLRISRFARYVSNFTPPTAALPTTASSTVADPYYNYTSLLLHMDGTNASTNFVDSGPSALTVTAAANAQISTTQSKFGAASGYFDGTGDSLTIPANSVFALGTGNYTIEGWFYSLTSGSSLRGMIDFRTAATGTNGLMLRENNGGFLVYLNNATILSTTTGRVANQWQHVALVRNGTTVTLYVDGVSQTSVTSSTNLTDNVMRISGFVDTQSSVYTYNGYMDDIRITKYARYTAAFTPPTTAFPNA